MQRKRVSKRGQKVDPLEIKSGPPWRVQFWSLFGPFIVANLLRRLFQVEASMLVCVTNSAAEEGLTPVQRKRVSKRGQKVDPLEIKSGPPWRVQFWSLFGPFIVANLLRRLFQVEADLTSNSCGWNLELGRPIFARLLFLTF